MSNKKNDILKAIIQKVELDQPAPNFTEVVMNEVKAEAHNEVVINRALKSLLIRTGIEIPQAGFTRNIMTQIKEHNINATIKPIISKNVWRLIGIAGVFFVGLLLFSEQTSTSPQGLTPYFMNVGKTLNTIFVHSRAVPPLYLITFISVSVLLLVDYILNTKINSEKNRTLS